MTDLDEIEGHKLVETGQELKDCKMSSQIKSS